MDMSQYMDVFIDEATEHLQSINENMLLLEKKPENMELVQEIFRSAHTLKGMSATMGFEQVADLTHNLENVLDQVRQGVLSISTDLMDTLFHVIEVLENLIEAVINQEEEKIDVGEAIQLLNQWQGGKLSPKLSGKVAQTQPESGDAVALLPEEVWPAIDQYVLTVLSQSEESGYQIYYVHITLVEDCLLKSARAYMVFQLLEKEGEVILSHPPVNQIEEEAFDLSFGLIFVSKLDKERLAQLIYKVSEIEKVTINQLSSSELKRQTQKFERASLEAAATEAPAEEKSYPGRGDKSGAAGLQRQNSKTIRVNIDRLDALMNLFSELVIDRGRLEQISRELQHTELQETVEHMSRMSSDLQDLILKMRMVPVEQVFNRFPRMVRSLSRELGKEVELIMSGTQTELDRTVIDEIGDPLVHLLRNAIDHGLEKKGERLERGKPAAGRLELKAYHSGNHVLIEVKDDGRGIDREKVLAKAIERGLLTREEGEKLTDEQVYQLIFASGFSTAEKVSDVSGRGVGLDVVKNKIESLGGTVTIASQLGKGTTFTIQLPLTLSIITALLIKVGSETYAIPLTSIIEVTALNKELVRSVQGERVIDFRGKVVPLIFLHQVYDVEGPEEEADLYTIVIVKKGDKLAGLVVDSFIGQQEVVLKSLGHYLKQVFAISGATILGDGQVALIIDCNALIK